MIGRAAVLATMLLSAAAYGHYAAGAEAPVTRAPLSKVPAALGSWRLERDVPLAADVKATLGVDDYTNRIYSAASGAPIGLYIGYYGSQRQGDTIHSPENCLPGAGWMPVESGTTTLTSNGRRVTVNRYVVQKDLDRDVVLYWYEGRGRIVANEYANKLWLMADAARLHRTNGALVRVMAPVLPGSSTAEAGIAAGQFAETLLPQLPRFLP